MQQRLLITGAGGFIGSAIARHFAPGNEVVGVTRSAREPDGPFELVAADLTDGLDDRQAVPFRAAAANWILAYELEPVATRWFLGLTDANDAGITRACTGSVSSNTRVPLPVVAYSRVVQAS